MSEENDHATCNDTSRTFRQNSKGLIVALTRLLQTFVAYMHSSDVFQHELEEEEQVIILILILQVEHLPMVIHEKVVDSLKSSNRIDSKQLLNIQQTVLYLHSCEMLVRDLLVPPK